MKINRAGISLLLVLGLLLSLSACGGNAATVEAKPQAVLYIEGVGISEQYPLVYNGSLGYSQLSDGLSSILGVPIKVKRVGVNYQDEKNGISVDLDLNSAPILFFEDAQAKFSYTVADAKEYEQLVLNSIYLTFIMNLPDCWDKTFYYTVDGGKSYAMLYTGRLSDTDAFVPMTSAQYIVDKEKARLEADAAIAALIKNKQPVTEDEAYSLVEWYISDKTDAVYDTSNLVIYRDGLMTLDITMCYGFTVAEDRNVHQLPIAKYAVDTNTATMYEYDRLNDSYTEIDLQ